MVINNNLKTKIMKTLKTLNTMIHGIIARQEPPPMFRNIYINKSFQHINWLIASKKYCLTFLKFKL